MACGWCVGGVWIAYEWRVGGTRVACGWHVGGVWIACGCHVAGTWVACGWCVGGMWMVCEWHVRGVWMACGWCVGGVWMACRDRRVCLTCVAFSQARIGSRDLFGPGQLRKEGEVSSWEDGVVLGQRRLVPGAAQVQGHPRKESGTHVLDFPAASTPRAASLEGSHHGARPEVHDPHGGHRSRPCADGHSRDPGSCSLSPDLGF